MSVVEPWHSLQGEMPPSGAEHAVAGGRRKRQTPGAACVECRSRKLRCDRGQPCGQCREAGIKCQVGTCRPRGPKRGHLSALRTRIATLEETVLQQQQQQQPQQEQPPTESNAGTATPSETLSFDDHWLQTLARLPADDPIPEAGPESTGCYLGSNTSDSSHGSPLDNMSPTNQLTSRHRARMGSQTTLPVLREEPISFPVPAAAQAELNQLYFDRIHEFIPIIHRRRYLSWRQDASPTASHLCLQYAMWTQATSASGQYRDSQKPLYHAARQALVSLHGNNADSAGADVEQIQAWLLIAVFELTYVDFRRGWLSAGCAFRLIQYVRLHELDASTGLQTDPVEQEQNWRTFWMGYILDRFVSLQNGSPLTLNEQVSIFLPSPETDFQNGHPISNMSLVEALTNKDLSVTSPFVECIIVATISGRTAAHQQQTIRDISSVDRLRGFWDRHVWIDAMVTRRINFLSSRYPEQQHQEPTILFVSMMWRAIILQLYKTMRGITLTTEEHRLAMLEYAGRAACAAQEVTKLENELSQFFFKVHPLTRIPLSLRSEYFAFEQTRSDSSLREAEQAMGEANGLGWPNFFEQPAMTQEESNAFWVS